MFSKYKSSVEHELHRVVPDSDKSEAYRLSATTSDGSTRRQSLRHIYDPRQSPQTNPLPLRLRRVSRRLFQGSPAAAALELIHNFSLIHDDIQDPKLERRHQPTVWHLWGIPKALWSATLCNALVTYPIRCFSQRCAPRNSPKSLWILTESYTGKDTRAGPRSTI
ncbi:MAG: hypothetical protein Ct9H300mP11_19760 [Chloroflexota bacterium]|nr:MAG: hypothetical protein Ct9H300mP11_19760 [Chloroflexota bacterium]